MAKTKTALLPASEPHKLTLNRTRFAWKCLLCGQDMTSGNHFGQTAEEWLKPFHGVEQRSERIPSWLGGSSYQSHYA